MRPAIYRLEREQLQRIFDVLAGEGYRLLDPAVRDGARAPVWSSPTSSSAITAWQALKAHIL